MMIRTYRPEDNNSMAGLFYDTVHTVNQRDYSAEQLDAWAPEGIDANLWCKPFAADYTLIAEEKEAMVGFANLTADGHLDRLYVSKDHQGQGIATALLNAIEKHARQECLCVLTVDASITAVPFFVKHGYATLSENSVIRRGVPLTNYSMEKRLG